MLFVKRFCASHLKISKMPHRFQSNKQPVAPLGSRVLLDPDKVFDHNMWDHMQWSQEEEERAKENATENSVIRVQPELQAKYEREASRYWNEFYKIHKNHFFKDRKWLFLEFPEILPEGKSDLCRKVATENLRCTGLLEDNHLCEDNTAAKVSSVLSACYDNSAADEQIVKSTGKQFPGGDAAYRILEVGCGAGNSFFPILEVTRHHPGVFLYCCDFASEAVELIKSHPLIDSSRCFAFVHDVCGDASPYPFPDDSLDVILLIFVLSSIHPDRIQGVVHRLARLLKPGGMILFRDYGRYDASQLRFKKGRCLSENFYVRGDGTRAYFFTKDEIRSIFSSAGLSEVQNLLDRRLQVNRKKRVKIHRVWIQGKFQKQRELTQE
nr:mRNA N(3)-methylcytidine methyltransferase METTL8 [Zootoca vivipara]XP_034991364.1 mRNA N(3)-methylcytidine methyltransferase METTL8 [Zootoca vivipara]XP_034991373.1 mRNA N(3)-methylcytidine methyltransferase METTL8 [Zootoca vivipara]XP_034991381.1 mRNA N(3)-methylcytidine methyltransferase METTL8 [Zootoca vivipara]XP_034991389.1 mRNA N(3)-methylcytidine methyltransferase METTL8 [Zootoca vivipara]XP_034991399.1 mRNA N(3)-methylcytidine methyltransferase METTL8 [Zootoca vivipara]